MLFSYEQLADSIPYLISIAVFTLCILGASEEIFGNFLPSNIRHKLWPIYGKHEHMKYIPISILMCCVIFIYSLLRVQKDALVQYSEGSDAAVFNYLKFGVVLPGSIGFVILYSKISNKIKALKLYLTVLMIFASFFALFGYVLNQGPDGLLFGKEGIFGYLNIRDMIHGNPETLKSLQQSIPSLKFLLPVFWYWSISIFYAVTELWGNVGVSILVFQLANSVSSKEEASRIYPIFAIIGNLGMILSGTINEAKLNFEYIITFVLIACILMGIMYTYLFKYAIEEQPEAQEKKSKVKLSISDGFKMIINSRYLMYIALIVLSYNMSMNLVEVTWKGQVKEYFTSQIAYSSFQGQLIRWTGSITILLIFLSKGLISRYGWLFSAMITPIVLLVTSVGFFICVILGNFFPHLIEGYAFSPLYMAVMIGCVQNIATKATKYSLFDPTKEMLYIPIKDKDEKTKGKAAVDVIGGRMGKSAGGITQMLLLTIFSFFTTSLSQVTISPIIGSIVIIIMVIWIFAVKKAYTAYSALQDTNDAN